MHLDEHLPAHLGGLVATDEIRHQRQREFHRRAGTAAGADGAVLHDALLYNLRANEVALEARITGGTPALQDTRLGERDGRGANSGELLALAVLPAQQA